MNNATIVIRDGLITAIGTGIEVPAGAVEINLAGKYVYPSFVEPYGDYGIPEAKAVGHKHDLQPQMLSNKKGPYAWNEALKSEFAAHEHFTIDKKAAKELREAGFGTVSSHQKDGISRGSSTVVGLAEDSENEVIIKDRGAHHLSFRKGKSTQDYPSSLMGSIALLRQTYLDAAWYGQQQQLEEVNISLQAWNDLAELPQIFEVSSWQHLLRAQRVAEEFGLTYTYVSGGDDYQRIEEISTIGTRLILPLKFPEAYDVSDPYTARIITLGQLRHWERAPGNPQAVNQAGIEFAFTAHSLKKPGDLLGAVRKAIEYGLPEEVALRALTTVPAQMLGVNQLVGSLEERKLANFLITSGPIFDEETTIYHNWVQGKPFVLKELNTPNIAAGEYLFQVGGSAYELVSEGKEGKEKLKIKLKQKKTLDVTHKFEGELLRLSFTPEGADGLFRLTGTKSGPNNYSGRGRSDRGEWVDWRLSQTKPAKPEKEDEEEEVKKPVKYKSQLAYPNIAYGRTTESTPEAERILIRNATVWTNEASGVMKGTDVLFEDGKIIEIGKSLSAGGALIIDGTGKHLTPGIIDEHSHIALASVNEGSQVSSAEVRMTDVIDATDVDIYRQLSGGVTTSQLLHGSANPIGGQSAIVKLRWGATPQDMVFATAPPFIKFALGENVKQSNWGDEYRIRYPQTRMGVEQVFESYITRAKEYGEAKARGGTE
ncbi:MAG: amidohydrolase, partial [Bacteroidota bacterium]